MNHNEKVLQKQIYSALAKSEQDKYKGQTVASKIAPLVNFAGLETATASYYVGFAEGVRYSRDTRLEFHIKDMDFDRNFWKAYRDFTTEKADLFIGQTGKRWHEYVAYAMYQAGKDSVQKNESISLEQH